jgi:transitional endoplasmic reticulum ATPase
MSDSSLSQLSRGALEKLVIELRAREEEQKKVDLTRTVGSQINVPPNMSLQEAIKHLERRIKEDETVVVVLHQIHCHPLDGALALWKAIQRRFGWSSMQPTPGFFGETPPAMISMQTGPGPDDVVQVPWGRVIVPCIDGILECGYDQIDGVPIFQIRGKIKQASRGEFLALAKAAEHIVNTESVYKGKAVNIKLTYQRDGRDFDPNVDGFKFMDIGDVNPNQLIFDGTTEKLLNTTLFSFLEHADKFRAHGIPLKRGILLEGPYGVGKTLTARVTAHKAVTNGFTFILVEDARDLDQVITMARRYQPAVIFVEDIDRVVNLERDINVDSFLNTIDGIQSKNTEIFLVMTTNHVENIHRAMLRPGRLDAVISLNAPDEAAVSRLLRWYAKDMLGKDADLTFASQKLAGHIPATIREVVERAKGVALIRSTVSNQVPLITTEDLELSVEGMARHLELMKDPVVTVTPIEVFANTLGKHLATACETLVNKD